MRSEYVIARIEALPEQSRKVLFALLDFLIERADAIPQEGQKRTFKFDWEGGLSDAFSGVSAVELQHRANEWR